jgi:hypothetical protein
MLWKCCLWNITACAYCLLYMELGHPVLGVRIHIILRLMVIERRGVGCSNGSSGLVESAHEQALGIQVL